MERGIGTTTRQMEAMPIGGVFIWCNGQLDYAVGLANKIGRNDLLIKSPEWLERGCVGLRLTGIGKDHATKLTDRQWREYLIAQTRVR